MSALACGIMYTCIVALVRGKLSPSAALCLVLSVTWTVQTLCSTYVNIEVNCHMQKPVIVGILVLGPRFGPFIQCLRRLTNLQDAERYFLGFGPFEIGDMCFTILYLLLSAFHRIFTLSFWIRSWKVILAIWEAIGDVADTTVGTTDAQEAWQKESGKHVSKGKKKSN